MFKKSVKFICEYKNEHFGTMCHVISAATLDNPDRVKPMKIYGCPICNLGNCDNSECNLHTQDADKVLYKQI